MEIEINGKKYTLRKIKYVEALETEGLSVKEANKLTLKYGAGLTEEQIKDLDFEEGIKLVLEINKFNNLDKLKDFLNPTGEQSKS